MPERKRKRRFFDLFSGMEPMEGGSGYSISVTYDSGGKPLIRVETHGEVDLAELRRDIEQRYPGARIEGLEKKPLIKIMGEEETRREEEKPERKKGKSKKKSLIRVVK